MKTISKTIAKSILITNTNALKCSVEFGMPSKSCINHGICYINVYQKIKQDMPKREIQSIAYLELNEDILKLSFIKDSIDKTKLSYHFKDDNFLIIDPYYLTEELSLDLGTNRISLHPGRYKVFDNGVYLEVKIDVKK